MKDIVLVEPGETVDVLAYYGPWNGLYMFHCHNLVHEDHAMMAALNVTSLKGLGYDDVESLGDPTDARFTARDWSADAYNEANIQSTLSYLGGLGAYNQITQLESAVKAYYSTNPAAASETSTAATTTNGQGYLGATPTQNYANHGGYSSVVETYAVAQVATSTPAVTASSTSNPKSQSQGSWTDWSNLAQSWGHGSNSAGHGWRA